MRNRSISLASLMRSTPSAGALISGRTGSGLRGTVRFYRTDDGTLVLAQITGLPMSQEHCGGGFFGFHIHEGTSCKTANTETAFPQTKGHFNPTNCQHPYHKGDMPPLLGNNGVAFSAFLTNRFTIDEIIGRTVVIHSMADDFKTQPGGDSGEKIGCGEIIRIGK